MSPKRTNCNFLPSAVILRQGSLKLDTVINDWSLGMAVNGKRRHQQQQQLKQSHDNDVLGEKLAPKANKSAASHTG